MKIKNLLHSFPAFVVFEICKTIILTGIGYYCGKLVRYQVSELEVNWFTFIVLLAVIYVTAYKLFIKNNINFLKEENHE